MPIALRLKALQVTDFFAEYKKGQSPSIVLIISGIWAMQKLQDGALQRWFCESGLRRKNKLPNRISLSPPEFALTKQHRHAVL